MIPFFELVYSLEYNSVTMDIMPYACTRMYNYHGNEGVVCMYMSGIVCGCVLQESDS